MEEWIPRAKEKGYIRGYAPDRVTRGLLCDAASNAWYPDGVSFDWTALHKRLKGFDASGRHPATADLSERVAALAEAGSRRLRESPNGVMVTVVELAAPHWIQPLDDSAQDVCVFSVRRQSGHAFDFYTFLRGAPGESTICQDVLSTLSSVCQQLVRQGVSVHQFLGSFVIFGTNFNALLQQTAGVHKALKGPCGEVNAHFSSFAPRKIFARDGSWWTPLPLEAVKLPEDVALFTTDLFFQWLEDSHLWRCLPPVRVFAEVGSAAAASSTDGVAQQRLLLFERFVRKVVLPGVDKLGFRALAESLPEEGGDLWELAGPLVAQRRVLVGPQKWSALDLRLALGCLAAYEKDPVAALGRA